MPNKLSTALVGLLAFAGTGIAQQFLTDRDAFLGHVEPGFYEEKFDGWSEGDPLDGHQAEREGPGPNDFGLTISATGPGNNMLYSLGLAGFSFKSDVR